MTQEQQRIREMVRLRDAAEQDYGSHWHGIARARFHHDQLAMHAAEMVRLLESLQRRTTASSQSDNSRKLLLKGFSLDGLDRAASALETMSARGTVNDKESVRYGARFIRQFRKAFNSGLFRESLGDNGGEVCSAVNDAAPTRAADADGRCVICGEAYEDPLIQAHQCPDAFPERLRPGMTRNRQEHDIGTTTLLNSLLPLLEAATAGKPVSMAAGEKLREIRGILAGAKPSTGELSEAQVASACLTKRHDFGLLEHEVRMKLMAECRSWWTAISAELDVQMPSSSSFAKAV